MMFQNYDYTQPFQAKADKYDGMMAYDGKHRVEYDPDERYEAAMALGSPESADLRMICFGFNGSGASSFMLKCAYNEFSADTSCNKLLSWDHHQFQYEYEDETVRIAISDLKGFDSSISKKEMKENISKALSYANVVLLLYSIDSIESFEGDYSVCDIKESLDESLSISNERKIVLLVATKNDLERNVSRSRGEELANEWEIPFFEISCKTGVNMAAVLDQICDIRKYDGDKGNYPLSDLSINRNVSDDALLISDDNNNNNIGIADREEEEAFLAKDKLTFAPHCCCCGWLEHCLLNYSCCGSFCGFVFYIPFMVILYILWLLQIPLTLMINLFAFILCCNFCKCECCRGSLFIADDDSVPSAHHGVMLHTAESIRDLYLLSDEKDHDLVPPDSPKEIIYSPKGRRNKQQISILQWNVFGQLGRYWKRYPLLTTSINDADADILCLQEVVTSKWWRFGTINTLKRINAQYRGFHVSTYNVLHDHRKLFFQYSCCWRNINECQSCCNLYCLLPFWRDNFWKYSSRSRSNKCCNLLFNTFNGSSIAQCGNAVIFKNNYQLFRSYIPLGRRRTALRALYILKSDEMKNESQLKYGQRLSITIQSKKKNKEKKRKKIWIVSTHLSSEMDSKQIEEIIKWMETAQNKICKADATIICGDFNNTKSNTLYEIMHQNGYQSVVKRKKGKEEWTFPTETWKYSRHDIDPNLDENINETRKTKDYIWIKSNCHINIDRVRLIGREYIDARHKGDPIKIFPSDHLGIYLKISI